MAAILFYQGRKELSFQEIEQASKDAPDDIDVMFWQGIFRWMNGENAAAEATWRKVIEKNPLFLPSRISLADALRIKGDPTGAIRELDKVLEQDPRESGALQRIAAAYIDLNDLPNARRYLEAALATGRRTYDAEIMTAIVAALEGKAAEAKKTIGEEALKFAALSPFSTLSAAELFAALNEPQTALDWLERAIRNGDERIEWFERDRLLAPIRGLPRYKQIIDSIAFRREQRARGGSPGR